MTEYLETTLRNAPAVFIVAKWNDDDMVQAKITKQEFRELVEDHGLPEYHVLENGIIVVDPY